MSDNHEHEYNDATGDPYVCPVESCDFGTYHGWTNWDTGSSAR